MRSTPLCLLLIGCWVTPKEVEGKLAPTTPTTAVTGTGTGATGTGTGATGTGTGATGTGTGATGTGTGTAATGTGTGVLDLTCVDHDIGSWVGDNAHSGDTFNTGPDLTGGCLGAGTAGNDLAFQWTPPNTGCFAFDTSTASFDTVVYVREGDCTGPEVGCNDDVTVASTTSEVGVQAQAGTTYIVVVDGFSAGSAGTYALDVHPANLLGIDRDLGNAAGTFAGDTFGADDTINPTQCIWDSGADTIMSWEAPSTGVWTFTLDSNVTDFDSVLTLHRQCTPDAFACDDFAFGNGQEVVQARLYAGEQVLVRVAGYDDNDAIPDAFQGNWQLDITN